MSKEIEEIIERLHAKQVSNPHHDEDQAARQAVLYLRLALVHLDDLAHLEKTRNDGR